VGSSTTFLARVRNSLATFTRVGKISLVARRSSIARSLVENGELKILLYSDSRARKAFVVKSPYISVLIASGTLYSSTFFSTLTLVANALVFFLGSLFIFISGSASIGDLPLERFLTIPLVISLTARVSTIPGWLAIRG